MPLEGFSEQVNEVIPRLAVALAQLDPGELARLRRMDVDGPGEATFWALAAQFDLPGDRALWLLPVKLMALLTAKGDPRAGKRPAHEGKRALGTALADAGFSETRLLRLMERAPEARADAMERTVRFLAARGSGEGVNCREVFWLLHSDAPGPLRQLADRYFRASARAEKQIEGEIA
jgi:CRISPR system Cascade subunit CasB